jgi:hypothetical protein
MLWVCEVMRTVGGAEVLFQQAACVMSWLLFEGATVYEILQLLSRI